MYLCSRGLTKRIFKRLLYNFIVKCAGMFSYIPKRLILIVDLF